MSLHWADNNRQKKQTRHSILRTYPRRYLKSCTLAPIYSHLLSTHKRKSIKHHKTLWKNMKHKHALKHTNSHPLHSFLCLLFSAHLFAPTTVATPSVGILDNGPTKMASKSLKFVGPDGKFSALASHWLGVSLYDLWINLGKRGAKRQACNIQCHEKPEAILKGCRSDTRSGHRARIEWHKRAKQSQVLGRGRVATQVTA
jgi:hypothetical protein